MGLNMQISPIKFSKIIPLETSKELKNKNSDTKTTQNIKELPLGYGLSNIAFCGKKKRPVKLEEFLKTDNTQKPKYLLHDLPILKPYANIVFNAVKYLTADGKCLILFEKDIDSKEIFIQNLRSFIDTDKLQHLDFKRGKPFIDINLADFEESSGDTFYDLQKSINRQIKSSEKPVLLVSGVRALFSKLDSPYDFSNNSLFNSYPTIFFVDEGYETLSHEEATTLKQGYMTKEEREKNPDNDFYNSYEFEKIKSKVSFLNSFIKLKLPSIDSDTAYEYLQNPWAQKHLITRGMDVKIPDDTILFAITLSEAAKYFTNNYYNPNSNIRLLVEDAVPVNALLDYLKGAFSKALIQNPDAKEITVTDITDSLPQNFNWFNLIATFGKLKQKYYEELEKSSQQEEYTQPKEQEVDDKKDKDEEINDNIEGKEKADEEDVKSGNYEIVPNPKTRFSDVGGMYNIKRQLKEEFIDILKNPRVKNSQKPSGILLSGPPGCGKTLLARAIAGESNVPFITTAGSSFIEIYVGTGAKRIRELYNAAREQAQKHPSKTVIVFIDEFDSVGGSRKGGGSSEDSRTVAALLHEMDGSNNKEDNDIKVITIVATNHEDAIDSALVRSGRIDLKYKIDDPRYSLKAREEILKIHSKELNFKNKREKEQILKALAQTTAGLSGADLAELLKKANRMSLNINRVNNYVTLDDITEAQMQVKAGVKTDMDYNEYEFKQTVAHEAGHALNSMIIEEIFKNEKNKHKMPSRVLDFITNAARGNTLGATYFKPSVENKLGSKESCLTDLITLYGGYAIETEMFDTHSAGIKSDLNAATQIIENAVQNYDFGSEKHYLSMNSELTKSLFQSEMKNDIINFAQTGMAISKKLIRFAKPFIENYVEDLVKNNEYKDKVVTSEEFKQKFKEWLEKSGNAEEYAELCEDVKKQITEFCEEKDKEKTKLGF